MSGRKRKATDEQSIVLLKCLFSSLLEINHVLQILGEGRNDEEGQ